MTNSSEESPAGMLKVATAAAREAGAHLIRNMGRLSPEDIRQKGHVADFVTRIDRESEEIIVSAISRVYPKHSFLAEESSAGATAPGPGHTWIIDPLDGTTNFIHGYPAFAVSIALHLDGVGQLGVVYDPLRDEAFTAARGGGSWLGSKRLSVSGVREPMMALLATGFPFRNQHLLDKYLEAFDLIFRQSSDIRRGGAAALDLAYVAAGRCDGFFELLLSPWDIAAGALLIEEAGGMVSGFTGANDYLATGNIVAGCSGPVHEMLLGKIRAVFGDGVHTAPIPEDRINIGQVG